MAVSLFEKFENVDNCLDPAIGYRVWRLTGDRLRSLTAATVWEPGTTKMAACGGDEPDVPSSPKHFRLARRSHRSPEPRCQCGIYANHRLADALAKATLGPRFCVGAICCWGRLVIHQEGFRAEYAALIGLCIAPAQLAFSHAAQAVEAIARQYRVPMFDDPRRLVLFATEFGSSYAPVTD